MHLEELVARVTDSKAEIFLQLRLSLTPYVLSHFKKATLTSYLFEPLFVLLANMQLRLVDE